MIQCSRFHDLSDQHFRLFRAYRVYLKEDLGHSLRRQETKPSWAGTMTLGVIQPPTWRAAFVDASVSRIGKKANEAKKVLNIQS
jgi:hypothetical protein